MNEKLLQYIWNFKIFRNFDFKDLEGNPVEILDFGKWNHNSGPDFLYGKIKTKDLVLVGNIELHIKSSDWIFHHHSDNPEFQNIILHVVFLHDCEIQELQNSNTPTLELKNYIDKNLLSKYEMMVQENTFVPCEKIFDPEKIPVNFCENRLLEKLNKKAEELEEKLKAFKNNYEAVLFHQLAYAFGLKVNAEIFKNLVESIDFSIIQKIRQNPTQLEALLFGKSGWLENPEDDYMKTRKREYDFLKTKYGISDLVFSPKFLRLRPPNFPTIRLSQLTNLYYVQQNLFSKIINAKNSEELYPIFKDIKADEYWNSRFNFGKISDTENIKFLTKDFVDLIIINAVLPLKYVYHRNHNEDIQDEILSFYHTIAPEKNSILTQWKSLGVKLRTSLETQAFIHHFKNFCTEKKCLNCSIGLQLLKETR